MLQRLEFMCGIFAYMGHNSLSLSETLRILHILESEQELSEKTPVGGHGAGIAHSNNRGEFTLVKVGKTKRSPVKGLASQLKPATLSSRFILGHVRRASPQFEDTIERKEFAQPYKPKCSPDSNLVSAHNGFLQNYNQLRDRLAQPHHFESEQIKLNDSEVPAHLYEELLTQTKDPTRAAHALFEQIEGNNTIVILSTNKTRSEANLQAIQKGKTRGLVVWTNPKGEVLVCSREKPVKQTLNKLMIENHYERLITVSHRDSVNILAHFSLKFSTVEE